jgi:putative DNA primase/helicase
LVEQGDGRRYLAVPYAEKDQAKALGAKWDPNAKSWYDPGPDINAQLNKWLKDPSTPTIVAPVIKVAERKYLNVPYANKDEAKSLGAKWDTQAKLWYDPVGSNPSLEKWSMSDATSPK